MNSSTSLADAVQELQDINEGNKESLAIRPDWREVWEKLVRMGLGETTLRVGTVIVSFVFVALAVWVMGNFYLKGEVTPYYSGEAFETIPTPSLEEAITAVSAPPLIGASSGIPRLASMHTTLPALPRFDVVQYMVEKGDTIFAISQKFNLEPETILWGNYHILADNPHALSPGQELNILPTNGVYYEWHAGDGLNGVADYYGVSAESIVNYPGNHLTLEGVGDFARPNIEAGTWLVIPGGRREFVTWSAIRITRSDPSVAKIFGPGACGPISDGNIGGGVFIWPTGKHFISGFNYTPETNHYGVDIGGLEGDLIFAADSGVVVYAGWNDFGYGNVVVLDHGNGWQSLYAHLSSLTVSCGISVFQGDIIGTMGSTGRSSGPHLHYEMTSDEYGRVNPLNFMQ